MNIVFTGPRMAYTQMQCVTFFLVAFTPVFAATAFLRSESSAAFHIVQFAVGIVSWTFIEYIVHRFWMHGKGNQLYKIASKRHLYHHSHPHDLKITALHRTIMFLLVMVVIVFSLKLNNYFTTFAGFYTGFVLFCFMHLFLHQEWCRRLFGKLVQFHIFHHCKYPDRCHGVTVTWWDDLFGTAPPEGAVISERITQFYFNESSGKPTCASKPQQMLVGKRLVGVKSYKSAHIRIQVGAGRAT